MNRRSFLAGAIAAALAPKELIKPRIDIDQVLIDYDAIGAAYSRALAASLIQTQETIAAAVYRTVTYGSAHMLIKPGLAELVEEAYEQYPADWDRLFPTIPDKAVVAELRFSDESEIPAWRSCPVSSWASLRDCGDLRPVRDGEGVRSEHSERQELQR